jgi:hypothetical protein
MGAQATEEIRTAHFRTRTSANALKPEMMTPAERLTEIGEILAEGLMRLRARQSSSLSPDYGESSLDCSAHQSGHDDPGSLEVDA